jgi:hypothetical protein
VKGVVAARPGFSLLDEQGARGVSPETRGQCFHEAGCFLFGILKSTLSPNPMSPGKTKTWENCNNV